MEIRVTIEADKLAAAMHELVAAIQGMPIGKNKDFEGITDVPSPQTATAPVSVPVTTLPYQPPVTPAVPVVQTAPAQPSPAVPAAPVPTAVQSYTLDQLAQAAAVLRDAGKLSQLQALLQSFSVRSMQEIPPERYGEFATKLRELGAKI